MGRVYLLTDLWVVVVERRDSMVLFERSIVDLVYTVRIQILTFESKASTTA